MDKKKAYQRAVRLPVPDAEGQHSYVVYIWDNSPAWNIVRESGRKWSIQERMLSWDTLSRKAFQAALKAKLDASSVLGAHYYRTNRRKLLRLKSYVPGKTYKQVMQESQAVHPIPL